MILGEEKEKEAEQLQAMELKLKKSNPLHNFTMPSLKWNIRQVMVSMKVNSDGVMTPINRRPSAFEVNKGITIGRRCEADLATITRTATFKSSNRVGDSIGNDNGGGKGLKVDDRKPNFSSPMTESRSTVTRNGNKEERAKFSVSLSRQEIKEDFLGMGKRPHRRPKKRSKIVQNQLDSLFPGLWLTEVTADRYKVPDDPQTRKR